MYFGSVMTHLVAVSVLHQLPHDPDQQPRRRFADRRSRFQLDLSVPLSGQQMCSSASQEFLLHRWSWRGKTGTCTPEVEEHNCKKDREPGRTENLARDPHRTGLSMSTPALIAMFNSITGLVIQSLQEMENEALKMESDKCILFKFLFPEVVAYHYSMKS